MRLNVYQTELIVSTVRRHFGAGASVALLVEFQVVLAECSAAP